MVGRWCLLLPQLALVRNHTLSLETVAGAKVTTFSFTIDDTGLLLHTASSTGGTEQHPNWCKGEQTNNE